MHDRTDVLDAAVQLRLECLKLANIRQVTAGPLEAIRTAAEFEAWCRDGGSEKGKAKNG